MKNKEGKYILIGLILGAGIGYIGADLSFLTYYITRGLEINITLLLPNLLWGILLICLYFYFLRFIRLKDDKKKV